MPKRTPQQRFWSKVRKTPTCWIWQGTRDRAGYGVCSFNGNRGLAHRQAYELTVGPIPEGLHIDHLCFNPPCVNPAHLQAVTQAENNRRVALARESRRGGLYIPSERDAIADALAEQLDGDTLTTADLYGGPHVRKGRRHATRL